MNKTLKTKIISELEHYLDMQNLSANEFSKIHDIDASYISHLRNGKESIPVGNKTVEISDKYYFKIAVAVGLSINKEYWKTVVTPQMPQILGILNDAKEFGYTNIIIGESGCGKTFTSDLFVAENPRDHYKITVGSTDTINDLLDKLCDVLRIPQNHSKSKKINNIIKVLKGKRLDGKTPIIIFDEAEYMKQATLCNVKEFHDHLKTFCGIVLIGTNQLETKLERLKVKNRDGMPQFYRRVKLGIRRLQSIDNSFNEFLKSLEITDKLLIKFLQTFCENYGELHDVLVPAMREAERLGEPVTENLVRKLLNLPKL